MEFLKKAIAKKKEEANITLIEAKKDSIMFNLLNDFTSAESIEMFNTISLRFEKEMKIRHLLTRQESKNIYEFLNK